MDENLRFAILFPNSSNAWPPLQELLITGLTNTGDPVAEELALELAQKWVRNNWVAYMQTNKTIFEKYDVEQVSLRRHAWPYSILIRYFTNDHDFPFHRQQ